MSVINGRVASINRNNYTVFTEKDTYSCNLSGRFHYTAYSEEDYPIVGDYVQIRELDHHTGIIERVQERKNMMSRLASGNVLKAQYIASNVDLVFICMSLNEDFNIRKLQNLINLTYSVDAKPIILLTKRDLVEDSTEYVKQIRTITDYDIIELSAFNKDSIESLYSVIKNKTSVLVGSSGVGKSTIVNLLLKDDVIKTSEIRLSDAQGRHTTTYRELIKIDAATFLIDTPGIRKIYTYQVDDIDNKFEDITSIADGCSFRDCTHSHEPGCSVLQAIEDNELSNERLLAFNKVKRYDRVARAKEVAKFRRQIKNKRR